MRLWWVSMSLFMELAGEQGKVVTSCSTGIPHWEMRLERSAGSVVASCTSSTSSSSWKRDMVDSLVRSISTSIQLSMEEVFSMSKWSQGDPPVPGMLYPSLVRMLLLLLLLFICSLAKAVSDVNDAMML